tara:strand:- start:303 stop:512 length:210 start_codon:yes stop_codon:yes gene_type:complete
MNEAQTGTVKWFDNKKGYGFITPTNGDKDLFVHMSGIMMEGYKTLSDNQKVSYQVGDSDRGPVATNVTV